MIFMHMTVPPQSGEFAILPLAAGAAVYGFAFGFLAVQLGLPWWSVPLMSGMVHAGSAQIVAVEQFASSSSILGAIFAGAVLNLRYIGIVASLTDMLKGMSLWAKLATVHITSDESWALTVSAANKDVGIGSRFLVGAGAVMIVTWVTSTTMGAVVGYTAPDLEQLGLGFAFTAAFIAMGRGMWRTRADLLPWAVTFFISIGAVKLLASTANAIVIGTVGGLIATFVIREMRGPTHEP
ncbi:4-azaleucine resistance transporter AzlC [Roseovarius sp. MBR-51]|jgi:4-azaleucine resistance transporter AzlC